MISVNHDWSSGEASRQTEPPDSRRVRKHASDHLVPRLREGCLNLSENACISFRFTTRSRGRGSATSSSFHRAQESCVPPRYKIDPDYKKRYLVVQVINEFVVVTRGLIMPVVRAINIIAIIYGRSFIERDCTGTDIWQN